MLDTYNLDGMVVGKINTLTNGSVNPVINGSVNPVTISKPTINPTVTNGGFVMPSSNIAMAKPSINLADNDAEPSDTSTSSGGYGGAMRSAEDTTTPTLPEKDYVVFFKKYKIALLVGLAVAGTVAYFKFKK